MLGSIVQLTRDRLPILFFLTLCLVLTSAPARASEDSVVVIESSLVHLRSGESREWSTFPEHPQAKNLAQHFVEKANEKAWTLSLRQQDVKQTWEVRLNGGRIGQLVRDESDLRTDFVVAAGTILDGENLLEIVPTGVGESDDIRVGEIHLRAMHPDRLRSMATIELELVDDEGRRLPGRITIVDEVGTLIPIGADSGNGLAIREGVVYTATGEAVFGVSPGSYQIFGGRGFEYSIAQAQIHVEAGDHVKQVLTLKRVVDTSGWIACDTHVHTVTHSGHGDCTLEERMVTLAGEGIELPIATDHNKQIDYRSAAIEQGVDAWFTPVIGNEVTTKRGHFNVFPIVAGSRPPDHTQDDWQSLMADIFSTPGVKVAILNHARDIHSGFRPFSPRHHVSITGEQLDDSLLRVNAMELVNSGAVQTNPMELFSDWCGLLNRGLAITPVGCSDSHDVSRYIVGQGRTYIQCDDSNVGSIPISRAVESFLQGRVVVSYGLLAKLSLHQKNGPHAFGPGDLVTINADGDEIELTVEVHGPEWTRADSIELYVCGVRKFEQQLESRAEHNGSLKASVSWRVPRAEWKHDVWLTAVAKGPGIDAPFWKTALPYQPDSPEFTPYVLSVTGPIRVDVDGDGQYTAPGDFAQQVIAQSRGDLAELASRLNEFDTSVTQQVASRLRESSDDLRQLELSATGKVRQAIIDYQRAWRKSINAGLEVIE